VFSVALYCFNFCF